MKHPYQPQCNCARCVRERARREAQAAADPRRMRAASRERSRKAVRERVASRAEQHATYVDTGPQAWDDRE